MNESKEKAIFPSFGDMKKYEKLILNWKDEEVPPPSSSEYIQYMSNDHEEYEKNYNKYCKEPSIIEHKSTTNPSTSSTQQPAVALNEAPIKTSAPLTQLQQLTQNDKEKDIQLLPVLSINETTTETSKKLPISGQNERAESGSSTQQPVSAHNGTQISSNLTMPLTQLQECTPIDKEKVSNQEDKQEDDVNVLMDQDLAITEDETVVQQMDTPTTSSSTKLKYKSQFTYHDTPMDGFTRIFLSNVNEIQKLHPKIKKGLPVTTKDIHVGWRDVKFNKGKLEVHGYITLPSVPRQITKKGQKYCGVLKCTMNNFSSESKYLQHIQDVHYKNILKVFCPHPDCIESNVVFQNFGIFYQHSKKEHQIQNKILTMALELYSKVQVSRKNNDKRNSRSKSKKRIDQNQNQQQDILQGNDKPMDSTRKSKRTNMPTFKAKEAEQESRPRKYKRKVMNPKRSQTQNIPNLDEYEKMSNAYEELKSKYEQLKKENQILREFTENENKDEFLATIIQNLTQYGFQVCTLASKLEILKNSN